jgi:hypothetical protein
MLDNLKGDARFHQAKIDDIRDQTAKEIEKKEYYGKLWKDTENAFGLQEDISQEVADQN